MRVDLEDRKIDLELVSTPRRRKADRDALEVSKREPRGKGKGGRSGKGQKSGKPASAKEKLAAEAAREARSKSAKGKPSGSGRKRKSRK